MKTANVYDIERALQQPITPQQRQTAAASNPLAAIIVQRLDGVEGSLRQKLQTPPPPQGTVMNQYYQWPQQMDQMGLAQPGLEELAQQYASGGLVAFADGGVASMLPMGYAGYDDVPTFNGYSGGGSPLREVFPYTDFDEEDEDAFWEEERNNAVHTPAPIEEEKDQSALGKLKSTLSDIAFIKVPEQAPPPDHKPLSEDIARTGKAAWDRISGAGERWSERLAPITDRFKAGQAERERIEGLPAAYAAAMKAGDPMPEVKYEPTVSGEDIKLEKQKVEKSTKTAAEYAKKEAPIKAKKAAYNPTAQGSTVVTDGVVPQVGDTEIQEWKARDDRRMREMDQFREAGLREEAERDRTATQTPERQAVSRVVNSNLTADQQIAVIANYFQTDTSEAMRIKGEMEKDNARAGSLGILTALAGAVGAGLSTYGPGERRLGAGLMQMASGVMSEQQQAAARQAEINKLRREIAENPSKRHAEATKIFLEQQAAGRKAQQDLQNKLTLGKQSGEYRTKAANIAAGVTARGQDMRYDAAFARQQGSGQADAYRQAQIRALAEKAANDQWAREGYGDTAPTPQARARYNEIFQQKLMEYSSGAMAVPPMGGASPQSPATYRFTPESGFSVNQ